MQTKKFLIPAGANKTVSSKDFGPEKKLIFTVQEGARLTFVDSSSEIVSTKFHLQAGASLHFFSLIAEGENNISVVLEGQRARAKINGIYLFDSNQHAQLTTRQEHRAQNTHSSVVLRGALAGSAYVAHHGTIFVDKNAMRTKASQNNKTILLSPGSSVDSLPELEVLNNRVRCSHGSAVGNFNTQQMFYLRSRGFSENEAKRLLLQGFFALPLAELDDKKMKKELFQALSQKLQEIL